MVDFLLKRLGTPFPHLFSQQTTTVYTKDIFKENFPQVARNKTVFIRRYFNNQPAIEMAAKE